MYGRFFNWNDTGVHDFGDYYFKQASREISAEFFFTPVDTQVLEAIKKVGKWMK